MYGDVLANRIMRADDDRAGLFGHVDVLRHAAQYGASKTRQSHPACPALNDHVAFQDAPATDDDARLDDRQRTDLDIGPENGLRTDQRDGGGCSWPKPHCWGRSLDAPFSCQRKWDCPLYCRRAGPCACQTRVL